MRDNKEDFGKDIEFMSREMLDAYNCAVDEATPKLWDRIEAGYENEYRCIREENQKRKKYRQKKLFASFAAIVLVIIIAIPVLKVMNGGDKSSDKAERSDLRMDEDSVYATEASNNIGAELQENECDDNEKENAGLDIKPENSNAYSSDKSEEEEKSEENTVIEAECIVRDIRDNIIEFEIKKVAENRYDNHILESGDTIIVESRNMLLKDWSNREYMCTFSSVAKNENGIITGKIVSITQKSNQ